MHTGYGKAEPAVTRALNSMGETAIRCRYPCAAVVLPVLPHFAEFAVFNRIALFLATNLAVMLLAGVVMSLLGVHPGQMSVGPYHRHQPGIKVRQTGKRGLAHGGWNQYGPRTTKPPGAEAQQAA